MFVQQRRRNISGETKDPKPKIAAHSKEKKQSKVNSKAVQNAREYLLRRVLLNPKREGSATEKK